MKAPQPQQRALLQGIDSLIKEYGDENPQLKNDLLAHRESLQQAFEANDRRQATRVALKIAVWVKFIIDLLPDE